MMHSHCSMISPRESASRLVTVEPLDAMKLRLNVIVSAALILGSSASPAHTSDAQQLELLNRVLAGTKCEESLNNGRICDYSVGKLGFSIKDVGGTDTVIGFRHSDIEDEFYAVMYFGCIAVVPGKAHPRNYGLDYGVHVSPRSGNVFRTSIACRLDVKASEK